MLFNAMHLSILALRFSALCIYYLVCVCECVLRPTATSAWSLFCCSLHFSCSIPMAHGFVISRFAIISFVLYDYYPLGVSFLFYFANSTYNYRATLPIKRAKKEENIETTTIEMLMHRLQKHSHINTCTNTQMLIQYAFEANKNKTQSRNIIEMSEKTRQHTVCPIPLSCTFLWPKTFFRRRPSMEFRTAELLSSFSVHLYGYDYCCGCSFIFMWKSRKRFVCTKWSIQILCHWWKAPFDWSQFTGDHVCENTVRYFDSLRFAFVFVLVLVLFKCANLRLVREKRNTNWIFINSSSEMMNSRILNQ